jgi:hypothetical protein
MTDGRLFSKGNAVIGLFLLIIQFSHYESVFRIIFTRFKISQDPSSAS